MTRCSTFQGASYRELLFRVVVVAVCSEAPDGGGGFGGGAVCVETLHWKLEIIFWKGCFLGGILEFGTEAHLDRSP